MTMGEDRRFVCIALVVTLALLVYNAYVLRMKFIVSHKDNSTRIKEQHEIEKLQESLERVYLEIDDIRKKHSRLILKLQISPGIINASTLESYSPPGLDFDELGPSEEYERVRRRVLANTRELWYYMNHRVGKMLNQSEIKNPMKDMLREVADRKRSLLSDQERIPGLDGYEEWRWREATNVSDLIQRRLHYVQNPPDCAAARKIICEQDLKFCGIGCNYHHIVYCLVIAYALERCSLLSMGPKKHFIDLIRPLSNSCDIYIDPEVETDFLDPAKLYTRARIQRLPLLGYFPDLPIKPYYIPMDLSKRIARFNADPYSWWIGQILKYVIKLRRPHILYAHINRINFSTPIVGVHVRRTDKLLAEANYFSIHEYMYHVEDYYRQLEMTHRVEQRRVYLATDDVDVLQEAVAEYPQYTFYGDYNKAQSASEDLRRTLQGVSGAIVDVFILSKCDFVVCTFTSNIGRMALELMQTLRTDAAERFVSLDSMYHFSSGETRFRTAVKRDKRDKHIALDIGDQIAYKRWNLSVHGYVLGKNTQGPIPWYKTEEFLVQYSYPEYKQVPLHATASDVSLHTSL